MWHAPNTVLICNQQLVAAPRETIGPVQILDVAIDPFCVALAIIAQQGEIAGALLGDQHIAVGEDEEPAGIDEPTRKQGRSEARRHLERLAAIRQIKDRSVTIGPVFGAGKSLGSM
jgi:hypothetical protein